MTTNENPEQGHHHPRIAIAPNAPEVYRAMVALDAAAKKGLDPALVHLVKIRASQINHCAFCIDMHIKEARKDGETEERVYLLNAWEEAAGHYTAKEQAALALTEPSPSSRTASCRTRCTSGPPASSRRPSSPSSSP